MYPLIFHKTLSVDRWNSYPVFQQILMISNELNRSENNLKKSEIENSRNALERAMELTDLTINDPKWKQGLKELLRFRELLGMLYSKPEIHLNYLLQSTFIKLNPEAANMLTPPSVVS